MRVGHPSASQKHDNEETINKVDDCSARKSKHFFKDFIIDVKNLIVNDMLSEWGAYNWFIWG